MGAEYITNLLTIAVRELEVLKAEQEDLTTIRDEASKYENLCSAIAKVQPEWSDPKVTHTRMGQLYVEAGLLLDGLENVVRAMFDLDEAAQAATMVAHLGDENAATADTSFGGDLLNKILLRAESIEAVGPTSLYETTPATPVA